MQKGKFIVFEGLDGSGKSTQTKLLVSYLEQQGREVVMIDFPQHGERSSAMVDDYLTGKYGTAEQVGPYIGSVFYACDRYDASFKIKKWLNEGKIVIADRYLASNIGHQGGKIADKEERIKYYNWLYNFEYNLFGIPKPDKNIILKTSVEFSKKLSNKITDKEKIAKRKAYLGDDTVHDIHEKDQSHLKNALEAFLEASEVFPDDFEVVECIENGELLSPDKIHQKVLEVIKKII
ncbi:MAG: thymidylate kinase [Parcubacteria group bacterium]|nr:thymidylate kinase [Parcubacteria group bacterium]